MVEKVEETPILLHFDKTVQIYCSDVISALEYIPKESVDLIIADPPYNLSNGGFTCSSGKRANVDKAEWDKQSNKEIIKEFTKNWIKKCKDVLTPNGTIWISGTYHSIYLCGSVLSELDFDIINDICWYKPNASPNLSCRMFTASHETLIWAKKDKKAKHTFNYDIMKNSIEFDNDILKNPGKQMRSVWAIGTTKKWEKRYGKHPTQKPEELITRIVHASSNEGDVVLDPFLGSGTTGVISVRFGRKFIGVDFEKDYLTKFAIPRIKDEMIK